MNKNTKARFDRAVREMAHRYLECPDPNLLNLEELRQQALLDLSRLRKIWYAELALPHPDGQILAETYSMMQLLVETLSGEEVPPGACA